MPYETVVYSRQRLYEEIWKEPVHEVAKKYGISDVALAKICNKLNIPRPSRGYWARLKAGHKVQPVALPPLKAGESEEHRVTRWKDPPPPPISPEEAAFRARPEFQAKQVELPFELVVAPVLEKPHPLVAQAMKAFRKAEPDRNGLVHAQGLPISIGPNEVARALRILDALFKGVERAGHKVLPFESYTERARFMVNGIAIEFSMKERLVRGPHVPIKGEFFAPTWDHRPSGDLRFKIEWNREWRSERHWEEKSHLRLEESINVLFQSVLQIPETERAAQAQRLARAQLQFEEAERRRREEERRAELRRREEAVVDLARRWKEASLVREFVVSVREKAVQRFGNIEPGSPAEQWLTFAMGVAEHLDPTEDLFRGKAAGSPG